MQKEKSLAPYVSSIIVLVSSISVTGISFIDSAIWKMVIGIIGAVAYGFVGILFEFGVIKTKQEGREARLGTILFFLITGFFVYEGMLKVQEWFLSWALGWKITFFSVLGLLLAVVIVCLILSKISAKNKNGENTQGDDK